jgi:hypothetical protein
LFKSTFKKSGAKTSFSTFKKVEQKHPFPLLKKWIKKLCEVKNMFALYLLIENK